ncbi:hypothetical protein BASA81_000268 [Batrachochytrium salamandrivorans]|nr:hypothetical protein BASA81_000268 [Batrachochytrium salamandrivorans]
MGTKKPKPISSPAPMGVAPAPAAIPVSATPNRHLYLAGFVAVLAVFFMLLPSSAPRPPNPKPTISEGGFVSASVLAGLIPSTEMYRGNASNTLQYALYNQAPPAVLVVTNYESPSPSSLEGGKGWFVEIFFNNEVKAIAPSQSKSRLETFIGHQFHIKSPFGWLNVTMDSEYVVVKVLNNGQMKRVPQADPQPSGLPEFPTPQQAEALPTSTAKSIKIRNLSNKRFNEYWVPPNGEELVYQGVIEPNHEATTNSYLGHTFRFTSLRNASKVMFEFTVNAEEEIYALVDPKTAQPDKLVSHLQEVEFGKQYKLKTGRPWLSYYPHQPVKTFMWPAEYIGQEFPLTSNHGPDGKPFNFTLTVVSVRPRAFAVDYFISDTESDYIISKAQQRLGKSAVEARGPDGELVPSNTRTSKNAWLERGESDVLDRIFRRVADLLYIPEESLHHTKPGGCAESLQVVYYQNSAHYAPHHDWGVHGGPHTRLATVLLYLNEPEVGGSTTFPKAVVGKQAGLEVKPKRGKAVLFYSQHPDGNVDDESLHEARPVTQGEKWLANVWVHDKMFWGKS